MTTPANPDDLTAFVHQQLENQRFRAGALKTLAHAMPAPETGAYLTETADLLLADVDAKRRILDEHPFEQGIVGGVCGTCHGAGRLEVHWDGEEENLEHVDTEMVWPCPTVRLLALPFADRGGFREEWRPA